MTKQTALLFTLCMTNFVQTNNKLEKQQPQQPSFAKASLIGCMTGLSEVATGRPLDYLKTKVITQQPISRNVLNWYAGVGTHAASIVPATVVQTQLESGLQKVLPAQYSAPAAGLLSGLFVTPCERVILEQQQGKDLSQVAASMKAKGFKELYKGLPMISLRELIFTAGYMQVMPTLKQELATHTDSATLQKIGAATLGGTVLALASHPTESIRIWQQTGKGNSALDVIRAMRSDKAGLLKNLFAGASYRTGRYALALMIMAETRNALCNYLKE